MRKAALIVVVVTFVSASCFVTWAWADHKHSECLAQNGGDCNKGASETGKCAEKKKGDCTAGTVGVVCRGGPGVTEKICIPTDKSVECVVDTAEPRISCGKMDKTQCGWSKATNKCEEKTGPGGPLVNHSNTDCYVSRCTGTQNMPGVFGGGNP